MKIVIAPDSFKGSAKSPAVARAMAQGVRDAAPTVEIVELPVGDGGEGTLEALVTASSGEMLRRIVRGPLGDPVEARLGLLGDGRTVFVEMAEAAGLSRLAPEERDPFHTTTYGVGQMLAAAAETGRPRILVGIGGSATNDGGAGMLQALGARLLDSQRRALLPGGAALRELAEIDLTDFRRLGDREVVVACDVTNPLLGPQGATAIYGPQKGVTPEQIPVLDACLARFADLSSVTLGQDWREAPGAGAAGGLGFALLAFLGARLERGVDLVLDAIDFRRQLDGADLVLTGEGRIDRQTTSFGKTLTGIGARAAERGIPVIALGGSLGPDLGDYRATGITTVLSTTPGPMELADAMLQVLPLIRDATRRAVELFLAGKSRSTAPI